MLAITGTDGKTTTTLLAVEMLRAAGLRTIDAGNTETPLVDAIALDLDAFVVEATSFRLAWTPTFRAEGAAWLNLAPDHLNWHRSMSTYELAKAQIYANQRPDDVAIGFVDDADGHAPPRRAPGRHVTFGASGADYYVVGRSTRGPDGDIAAVEAMRRSLPHDITNALAASALVLETGLVGPTLLPRHSQRSTGRPIASNTSEPGTTSRGTTTPRQRHRTPPRPRFVRSITSCSSPAATTSTSTCHPMAADRRPCRCRDRPRGDGSGNRRSVRGGRSSRGGRRPRRGGRAGTDHRPSRGDGPVVAGVRKLRSVPELRTPWRTLPGARSRTPHEEDT